MKAILGSAVALSLGMSSVAMAAPTHNKYSVRGDSASVFADEWGECKQTSFSISAIDEAVKSGGSSTPNAAVFVSYSSYDYCTGASSYGWAQLPLTQDLNLESVSLDFSLELSNWGTEVDADGNWISVDLGTSTLSGTATLVGTGTAEKGNNSTTYRDNNYRYTTRYSGTTRSATVTLTANNNGEPLSLPYVYGSLANYKNGTMEIYHQ